MRLFVDRPDLEPQKTPCLHKGKSHYLFEQVGQEVEPLPYIQCMIDPLTWYRINPKTTLLRNQFQDRVLVGTGH